MTDAEKIRLAIATLEFVMRNLEYHNLAGGSAGSAYYEASKTVKKLKESEKND